MTKTGLEMAAIKSKEDIAEKDRNVKKGELDLKRKQFKHQKAMDVVGALTGFIPKGKYTIPVKKGNDPIWYKRYLQDLDKFTNVATYTRLGMQDFDGKLRSDGSLANGVSRRRAVPGIAAIHWIPTVGSGPTSVTPISTSPINQILMRTKEQVLKSNSRSSVEYEASDLGYNFLATGSIALAITEFERLVLTAQSYKADNAYFASALLEAQDAVPSNWIDNLPDARKYLLILKKRFNSALVAPADLTLYQKYMYLGASFYKDAEVSPYQTYMYVADVYYRLANDTKTLEPVKATTVKDSPQLFYNAISNMIQRLAENPDYISMFADLRSAFGDHLLQISETVDESAELEARFDNLAIEQIGNVRTLPVFFENESEEFVVATFSDDDLRVKQDSNGFLYQGPNATSPYLRARYADASGEPTNAAALKMLMNMDTLVNMHKDNITGDDILDVTRWFTVIKDVTLGTDNLIVDILACDTTVATHIKLYAYSFTSSTTLFSESVGTSMLLSQGTTASAVATATLISIIQLAYQFDWMPLIRVMRVVGATNARSFDIDSFVETERLFSIEPANLQHLHSACILSELFIDSSSFKR